MSQLSGEMPYMFLLFSRLQRVRSFLYIPHETSTEVTCRVKVTFQNLIRKNAPV